jgi:hypothetical protein
MHDAEEFTHRYESSALRRSLLMFDIVDVVLLGALVIAGVRQWREATKKDAAPAQAPTPEQATQSTPAQQAAPQKPWTARIEDEPVPMYKQRTL